MEPTIKTVEEKKFIGNRLAMSLVHNRTSELWRNFMPRRKEIQNNIDANLYSIQVNEENYYTAVKPENTFQKWAAVEVSNFDQVPNGMETFVLPPGLYAAFQYKGLSPDPGIFQYIFTSWLPSSNYELDNRPQFEILGEKYKNNDPDSEEEIWIPIKRKSNTF